VQGWLAVEKHHVSVAQVALEEEREHGDDEEQVKEQVE
jgi:hypothetical protein